MKELSLGLSPTVRGLSQELRRSREPGENSSVEVIREAGITLLQGRAGFPPLVVEIPLYLKPSMMVERLEVWAWAAWFSSRGKKAPCTEL